MSSSELSHHFNRGEFACECGCGFDTVDSYLLEALRQIRSHFKRPVLILSGCRCGEHNKEIGGAPNSQHIYARAADISVVGHSPEEVAKYAKDIPGLSVGVYSGHVHIDSRTGMERYWRKG